MVDDGNAETAGDTRRTEQPLDVMDSWSDVSKHVLNSYVEANRAIIAGLGLRSAAGASERLDAPIVELSYATRGWSFSRSRPSASCDHCMKHHI